MRPGASPRGSGVLFARLFIAQAMDMGDEVPHVRVVHGSLGFGLPRCISTVIIGEHADDVDVVNVFEDCLGSSSSPPNTK